MTAAGLLMPCKATPKKSIGEGREHPLPLMCPRQEGQGPGGSADPPADPDPREHRKGTCRGAASPAGTPSRTPGSPQRLRDVRGESRTGQLPSLGDTDSSRSTTHSWPRTELTWLSLRKGANRAGILPFQYFRGFSSIKSEGKPLHAHFKSIAGGTPMELRARRSRTALSILG